MMYDENGGWWDYVVLLVGDCWGFGLWILVFVILLFVKKGFVDYMLYDMNLILCFISCVYGFVLFDGVVLCDNVFVVCGVMLLGDLMNVFEFG